MKRLQKKTITSIGFGRGRKLLRQDVFLTGALWVGFACILGSGGPFGCSGQATSKGWAALRRGDLAGAKRIVRQGLRENPDSEKLLDLKLRVDLLIRDWKAAAATYEKLRPMVYEREELAARRLLVAQSLWGGLKQKEVTLRRSAARAANALGVSGLNVALRKAVEDPDPLVRVYANAALLPQNFDGWLGLMKLSHSPKGEVRRAAAETLEKISDRSYVFKTLTRLAEDPDPQVRSMALRSLASVSQKKRRLFHRALKLLVSALKDPAGPVRAEAASLLARFKGKVRVEWVRETLKDPSLAVRLAALRGLKKEKKTEKELRAVAKGDDLFLALRATVTLSKRGFQEGCGAVLERAMASKDWAVRAAALNAASSMKKCPQAPKAVARGLEDTHPRVRLAAARTALHSGWSKSEAEKVGRGLMKGPGVVAVGAAEVLAKAKVEGAAARLETLAVDALPTPRKRAMVALGRLGKGRKSVLKSWAKGPWPVRLAAARVLWRWRDR